MKAAKRGKGPLGRPGAWVTKIISRATASFPGIRVRVMESISESAPEPEAAGVV